MKRGAVQYHPSGVKKLVEKVAVWAATHTEAIVRMKNENDFSMMHSIVGQSDPAYADKKNCYGCGAHMKMAVYTLGIMESLLMLSMAKEVRARMQNDGLVFTEANLIHVMSLGVSDAVRHAITRCRYLGLVAQPENKRGSGYWVITHWGWMLLKGLPVPRYARYWRKMLLERSDETTTLSGAFKTHSDEVAQALERRRALKNDFRSTIGDYSASEWVGYGGIEEDASVRIAEKLPEEPRLPFKDQL